MTERSSPPRDAASAEDSVVFVVDDDPSMREALEQPVPLGRLRSSCSVRRPSSCRALPTSPAACPRHRLPGERPRFPGRARQADIEIPIIFITGHGDIPMSVRAMKAGAVDFLTKPFRDQDCSTPSAPPSSGTGAARGGTRPAALKALFESLTPREREVMALVTAGLMNKQVAGEIGVSEITVKIHRGHAMRKMRRQVAGRPGAHGRDARREPQKGDRSESR